MRRVQIGCVIAACLGLVACGDAKSGTGEDTTAGQNTGGAGTGGSGSDLKPGDPVDLDGDGAKDDGVAVDDDGDGQVDGVDTDGDGKSDKPLPSGGGTSGGTTGTSAGSNSTAGGTTGSTTGSDAATSEGDGLTCDGVGVCDDNFMDTCDADPDTCPATQTAGIDEPDWDCAGDPPANVYAYAKFPDGTKVAGANLKPGACVAFFEGAKDLFYVKWFRFGPEKVTDDCSKYDGCICPNSGGAFGNNWDRRLYAFTWNGEGSCEDIVLIDHGNAAGGSNNEQAVSNECRKYLYALHGEGALAAVAPDGQPAFDLPFSYVASGLPALKRRLADFPKIEVSCVEVMGPGVPKSQLMVKDVQTHAGFVAKK